MTEATAGTGAAPDRIRYRVLVTGRVQGVWYRDSCRREAVANGVGGWVRNNGDGSVEAAVEGPREAVERLVAWMRVGPPRAQVDAVHVRTEDPLGETYFAVR
jgi:acylphosphatase